MNTRKARLIRAGILAARDPQMSQYVHLAPRLVRKTCRRETLNMRWRRVRAARAQGDAWAETLARLQLLEEYHHQLYPALFPAPKECP